MVQVVRYSEQWPHQFERAAARLRAALEGAPGARVEHVGSTSVPGLAAKPIIDIDVVVAAHQVLPAIAALEQIGYVHDGDLGLDGREAFDAPDDDPPRHVYMCLEGTLHVRNHLAVRDILRRRPDLRDSYAAVKLALAEDPDMDIDMDIVPTSPVSPPCCKRCSPSPTSPRPNADSSASSTTPPALFLINRFQHN